MRWPAIPGREKGFGKPRKGATAAAAAAFGLDPILRAARGSAEGDSAAIPLLFEDGLKEMECTSENEAKMTVPDRFAVDHLDPAAPTEFK